MVNLASWAEQILWHLKCFSLSVKLQYPSLNAHANLRTFSFFNSINIIKLHVYCHWSCSNSLQWAVWSFYWHSLSVLSQGVTRMKLCKKKKRDRRFFPFIWCLFLTVAYRRMKIWGQFFSKSYYLSACRFMSCICLCLDYLHLINFSYSVLKPKSAESTNTRL